MSGKIQNSPKYFMIAREMIGAIKSGKLKPGMRVLSENEIISRYRVSNTTARKSLQSVENQGYIKKVKGKGTFVRESSVVRPVTRILSFTKNMLEAGLEPSTKVLDSRISPENYSVEIGGRVYTLKAPVCKIHRLRFADNIPMMLEVRYISLALCPGIEKEDFSRSLYDLYEKKYQLSLSNVYQELGAIMIDRGVQDFFDLTEPIPALLVNGVTFCGKEMILEMEKSIYRGDKYRFLVGAT